MLSGPSPYFLIFDVNGSEEIAARLCAKLDRAVASSHNVTVKMVLEMYKFSLTFRHDYRQQLCRQNLWSCVMYALANG